MKIRVDQFQFIANSILFISLSLISVTFGDCVSEHNEVGAYLFSLDCQDDKSIDDTPKSVDYDSESERIRYWMNECYYEKYKSNSIEKVKEEIKLLGIEEYYNVCVQRKENKYLQSKLQTKVKVTNCNIK
ncbi:hypothetical protein PPL_08209 [Heterostelium album PN500]|uniref:Uncharacterized protein n=1 Tax=Heterostelium pallidum (strain ATCC 26659 / Pp 5 / PN500) TaxID=670386 RepID=D3BIX4_HETP5|nr:hypothetical protein PPL_08209 [Heterostelium album PN500]EFA78748.1 hypothetical protein PPL_08209 [Heterostelium album PN500]|eukprot:XP_020430872.1 hypothetical protein PPL_08209 [Heterostelium album PN500]